MKYAILSDIHSNSVSLQQVIMDAHNKEVDGFIFLGDFIGYFGSPIEVLEMVKTVFEEYPDSYWVLGNHEQLLQVALDTKKDWDVDFPNMENQEFAQIGKLKELIDDQQPGSASREAVDSLYRNIKDLEDTDIFEWFLKTIITKTPKYDQIIRIEDKKDFQIQLVHASYHGFSYIWPWDPFLVRESLIRPYLDNGYKKKDCNLILYGHTHLPAFYQQDLKKKDSPEQKRNIKYGEFYPLDNFLSVINPGSVGLPRDADNRASYVILDTEEKSVVFSRLKYDLDSIADELLEKKYCNEMEVRLYEAPLPKPSDNPPPLEYAEELRIRSELK